MDRSSSRRLGIHGYTRKTDREPICTGERHRCWCRACKFYRHVHWGLRPLSSSEDSSSDDEEEEFTHTLSRSYRWEYEHDRSSIKTNSAMYQIQQASIRCDCPIGEDVSIDDEESDRRVRKFDQNQEGLQTRKIWQPVSSFYHEDPLSTVQHDSLYTSVKVQCDGILNLLGLHEPRLEKKCSGSQHSTEKVSGMLEERECEVRHQEANKESSVLSRTAVKDQGESCVVEEENGDHLGPIPETIRSLWKSDRITNFSSAHDFPIRSDSTNDPASIGSWSWRSCSLLGSALDQKFHHNKWSSFYQ